PLFAYRGKLELENVRLAYFAAQFPRSTYIARMIHTITYFVFAEPRFAVSVTLLKIIFFSKIS
ncbi:MAG: hypothetical protein ABI760_22985, partial [Ferruginibacter sp.]